MASPLTLETDYLVVGCGATGMAFTDALIAECDARVVMVDRRHAPGGHWNHAYPFVRLHQPSAYYGVNSLALGSESIDRHGPNQGMYERATGAEVCAYYSRVMHERLLASGRVRHFPMCDYIGEHRFVSRLSGERYDVRVNEKLVDCTYLEPSVPETYRPPFEISSEIRCVTPSQLAVVRERADGFVIIGAGKTAVDTCLWLLEGGVPPDDIRWIRPRDSWFSNRFYAQGGDLVATLYEGVSLQMEAAARAKSLDDLFARLNAAEQLLRIDEDVAPSMFKGATASTAEVEQLRRIPAVIRLGHVRAIERDAIVLEQGKVPTSPRQLHVHCAAPGLKLAPAVPIFGADIIIPQPIRTGLIPFNAALVGFIEATRDDPSEKNRLCPPNPLPDTLLDWVRGTLIATSANLLWSQHADIRDWLERARLNAGRGLRQRREDPAVQRAAQRYIENALPGIARLESFLQRPSTHVP